MRKGLLIDAATLHMVPSPAAVGVKFVQTMRRRGTSITDSAETIVARVDHGRWVGDCPACNAGMALTPGVAEAFCFDYGCGHRFTNIVWPEADVLEAVEQTLRARPKVATRNWQPTETADDLRRENRDRGVPERHAPQAPQTGNPKGRG